MQWITTNDVESEVWRRLLEYANLELTFEALVRRHGEPDKEQKQNYQKQARQIRQIRVCVLQAREFFTAARESSLFTSPNHLYYGIVSLSSAIMLILGTGNTSLDMLRNDKSNKHHGLLFSTGITASQANLKLKILEQSMIEVLDQGHFKNWYGVLPLNEPIYTVVETRNENAITSNMARVGNNQLLMHVNLVGRKWTLLELLQFIPDLAQDLIRFKAMQCVVCRVNYTVQKHEDKRVDKFIITPPLGFSDIDELLDGFRISSQHINRLRERSFTNDNPSGFVEFDSVDTDEDLGFAYPTIRLSSDLKQMMYSKDPPIPEIAEIYLFSYGLSMLSRYYPDYWVSCLESHGIASKLVELTLSLALTKFPLLALNTIEINPITISTHRPPWFS